MSFEMDIMEDSFLRGIFLDGGKQRQKTKKRAGRQP